MNFTNFEEFWQALGRLYDSSLKHEATLTRLETSIDELRGSTQAVSEAAALLASAVQRDHDVIMAHEHRLDRTEITVEAILEDLRRHREGRPPQ